MDESGTEEFALAGAVPAETALPAYDPRDLDDDESDLDDLPSLTVGGTDLGDADSSAIHVRDDRADERNARPAPPDDRRSDCCSVKVRRACL